MCSEAWLIVGAVASWFILIITSVKILWASPFKWTVAGAAWARWGQQRAISGQAGTSGQLGVQSEGQGPKASHQEYGQIRNRAGKTIPTDFLVSPPPVFLPPISHFPFARVIFQNYISNVVIPLIKNPSIIPLPMGGKPIPLGWYSRSSKNWPLHPQILPVTLLLTIPQGTYPNIPAVFLSLLRTLFGFFSYRISMRAKHLIQVKDMNSAWHIICALKLS